MLYGSRGNKVTQPTVLLVTAMQLFMGTVREKSMDRPRSGIRGVCVCMRVGVCVCVSWV